MRVDYIVVGLGLAGVAFCEQLRTHNKRFVVFDRGTPSASTVASGLYNPIVLKRFVSAWKGHELMQYSIPFYETLEQTLTTSFLRPAPILRKLVSAAETNDWQHACDAPSTAPYMNAAVLPNNQPALHAPFGYGKLSGTGWLDCALMLSEYRSFLSASQQIRAEMFIYDQLDSSANLLRYNDIEAKSIVFTEGTGIKHNPWFSYLPLRPTKGELLVIHCPDLQESHILHSGVFVIPLGNDCYKVGATYDNHDHTTAPTKRGLELLQTRLQKLLRVPYRVVDHLAGLRPTTPDRRPMIGTHPDDNRMALINGLGSRGVLQAPFIAKFLMDFFKYGTPIPLDMDVNRYPA